MRKYNWSVEDPIYHDIQSPKRFHSLIYGSLYIRFFSNVSFYRNSFDIRIAFKNYSSAFLSGWQVDVQK